MVTKTSLFLKDLMKGSHLYTDYEQLLRKLEAPQKNSKSNKNLTNKKRSFKSLIKTLSVMDSLLTSTKTIKIVTNPPQLNNKNSKIKTNNFQKEQIYTYFSTKIKSESHVMSKVHIQKV